MRHAPGIDTYEVIDMDEWRDRCAVAHAQAAIEAAAKTIVQAIVTAFAAVILGSLIFAVMP